jgi:ATP-dependent DNA ligase
MKLPRSQRSSSHAEVTAYDHDGWTNLSALLRRHYGHLCIWVFDILAQNGKDLRDLPLASRREKLEALMARGAPM